MGWWGYEVIGGMMVIWEDNYKKKVDKGVWVSYKVCYINGLLISCDLGVYNI